MKLNEIISATITKEGTIKLRDNSTKAVINVTPEELSKIVTLHEKELVKREKLKKIEAKIKECSDHGFAVKKERDWLWLVASDNRYVRKVNDQVWGDLKNKDEETKVLFELGFQYSSHRMNFYWDCTKENI